MAFGLATEDDDGEALTKKQEYKKTEYKKQEYINPNNVITPEKQAAFKKWLADKQINEFFAQEVLESFGYYKIDEIKEKDLKIICKKFEDMLIGE